MLNNNKLIILILFIFFYQIQVTYSQYDTAIPGQFLIKFKKQTSTFQKNTLKNTLQANRIKTIHHSQIELWELPEHGEQNVSDVINSFQQRADIEYIAPNHVLTLAQNGNSVAGENIPSQQWALNNTGQSNGLDGADIDAPEAMKIRSESPDVKIGIIDSGIDWTHPDLINNIWQNLDEDLDGDGRVIEWDAENNTWIFDPDDVNGVDDDGNGYIDDFVGWDFYNNDNNPFDENGHGTHIAGIIGADGTNDEGVNGITWNVQMAALKIFGVHATTGSVDLAIQAMLYAQNKGFQITNHSYGSGFYNQALYETIDTLDNQLLIVSAGNEGLSVNDAPRYPAAFDLPNIVSVAGTNHFDNLASFSSYHATDVDLAAPGKTIFSTLPNNEYGFKSGTSMAAAFVTGAAALWMGECPYSDISTLKSKLILSADELASLQGKCAANGRLNINRLLQFEGNSYFTSVVTPTNLEVEFLPEDETAELLWDFNDGTQQLAVGPIRHTFPAQGWYTVCAQSPDDCASAIICERIIVSSPTTCDIEVLMIYDSESNNDNMCSEEDRLSLATQNSGTSNGVAQYINYHEDPFQSFEPFGEGDAPYDYHHELGEFSFSILFYGDPDGNGEADTCITTVTRPVYTSARQLDLGEDLTICDDSVTIRVDLAEMVHFQWYKDGITLEADSAAQIIVTESGVYEVAVTDECAVTVRDTIEVQIENCRVWPGDTDYNGLVDTRDVLQLYCNDGRIGPSRTAPLESSTLWQPQDAVDWEEEALLVNAKHSDCDGNGNVMMIEDLAVIDLNYNKTHKEGDYFPLENPTAAIKLRPHFIEKITDEDSTTFKLDLNIEHELNSPIALTGLAFTIDYRGFGSRAFLEASESVLGTNEELILFTRPAVGDRLDVVMLRADRTAKVIDFSDINHINQLASFIIVDQNIVTGDESGILQVAHLNINNVRMLSTPCSQLSDVGGTALSITTIQDNSGNRNASNQMVLSIASTPSTCETEGKASVNVFEALAPFSFAWSDGQDTETATDLRPGVHQVTVTASDHQQLVGYVEISGRPMLHTTVEHFAADDNETYTVIAQSTGGLGTLTYEWGDGQIGDTVFHLLEGQHVLNTIDQTSCQHNLVFEISATQTSTISTLQPEDVEISIHPTLVKNDFQVFYNHVSAQKMPLYIYDASGRLVRFMEIKTNRNASSLTIDFQDELPGFYFVRIGQSPVLKTFKLVKL